MLRRLFAACLVIVSFGGGFPLKAQTEILSRYRQDEIVDRVDIGPVRTVGRRVDSRLYLTEREAVELALENNLDVNVERHTRLARQWDIRLVEAAYDPVGTFGFSWDRNRTPAASVLQGGASVTDILTDYTFGYRHPFRMGSSLEVSFAGNRNRTTNFFSSLVPAIHTRFDVTFRQDLLKGFGKAEAEYDIELSRNNVDLSEQEFQRLAIEVIAQVQDQFWELEHSLKDVEVKQKSLELAETIYRQNQARFEVGTASRLEVVQTEAEVASRREELIRAQFSYRRVQDQLVKLMTSHRDPREFLGDIVPEASAVDSSRDPEPFDHLLRLALELRPEIRQSDLTIANRQVELRRSRDKLKPSLQLVAGYQQFGLGGTEIVRDFSQGFVNPPIVAVNPGGLWDSFSQVLSADYYGYLVGFDFQIPLGNTEARSRNAQAQIEINRARLQKEAVQQSLGLEIRDTLTQIEMNKARLEAAEAAVVAARERLDGEQARFEVGMGTTRELIEAQRDLLQAESVVVRARIDLIKSQNLLDKAVGRTFRRYNISLSEALSANIR
jgi:outer membrane protein